MKQNYLYFTFFTMFLICSYGGSLGAQSLELISSSPSFNETNVPLNSQISLVFDDPLDAGTVNSDNIIVKGSHTGQITGVFSSSGNLVTFRPTSNYKSGERISVTLTTRLSDDTGSFFRFGHTFSFKASASVSNDLQFIGSKSLIDSEIGTALRPLVGEPFDVDNDGDIDVIGASREVTSLYWFENDGNANFTTRIIDTAVSLPDYDTTTVRFSDFDSDGDSDILVISGSELLIYTNGLVGGAMDPEGGPLFVSSAISSADDGDISIVGVADFDNDGYDDIWYRTTNAGAYILYNDGTATFTLVDFSLDAGFLDFEGAVDLNNDGFLDLLLKNNGNDLLIYQNNKDRTFTNLGTIITGAFDYEGISTGDLNGDDFQDIFVTGASDRIVFNNGDFTFSEIPLSGNVNAIGHNLIADVNADGLEDLIFEDSEDRMRVYLNDGASGFASPAELNEGILRFLRPTYKMFHADLDGDNDLEIIGSSSLSSRIFFLQDDLSNIATLSLVQQGDESTDMELEVTLLTAATEDITFSIEQIGGSAEEGVDFESLTNKEVVVPQGTMQASIIIDVFEDDILESSEDVFFSLVNPVPSTVRIIENNLKVDIEDESALRLVSRSPAHAATQIGENIPIVLTFNMDVDAATVNSQSVRVFGKYGGKLGGTYTTVGNTVTFTLDPDKSYIAGERVTVSVPENGVQSTSGGEINKTTVGYFDVKTDLFYFTEYGSPVTVSSVGGSPRSAFPVDYDNDGDVDVLVGMLNGRIEENRNNGDGTFSSAGLNKNDGIFVNEIEVFDFENDGDTDLIAGSHSATFFDIMINDGAENFTFNPATNRTEILLKPRKITVYDMNSDGYDDLVFTGTNAGNYSFVVAKNNVGASLEIEAFGTGISPSTTHVIFDINQDGLPDILLNEGGTMVGYLNAENYNFTLADQDLLLGLGKVFTEYMGVFDFDNDGDEDIAVRDGQNVGWLVNQGDRWEERINGNIEFGPTFGTKVVDMNGDGNLDFLASSFNGFAVILANDREASSFSRIYKAESGARYITVADFDGDKRLDPLIVRQQGGVTRRYYYPNRIVAEARIVHVEGGFEAAPVTGLPRSVEYALRLSAPNTTSSAVTFDISDAGTGSATSGVDYTAIPPGTQITIEPGESEATFFVEVLNDGDVGLEETLTLTISNSSNSSYFPIVVASATGTIKDAAAMEFLGVTPAANAMIATDQGFTFTFDAVVIDNASNINKFNIYGEQSGPMSYNISGLGTREITLSPTRSFLPGERVYISMEENFGNGATTDEVFLPEPYSAEYVVAVTPFDMLEGFQSRLVHSGDLGGVVVFSDIDDDEDLDIVIFGQGIHYFLNDGVGNYAEPVQLSVDVSLGTSLRGGTIFDVDNDGDLDIITGDNANLFSVINPGDVSSTWTRIQVAAFSTSSNTGIQSFQNRDMDNDGDIDVVATLKTSDKVMLYVNDGAGNFTEQVVGSTTAGNKVFGEIFIGDIDNDGRPDMVTSEYRNNVHTWFNEGGNSFTKKTKSAGDVTDVGSLIDFDNDGDLDIGFGNYWTSHVRWLRNDGNRNWGSALTINNNPGRPTFMKNLDINGDGNVDMVSVSGSNDDLSVFFKEGSGFLRKRLYRVAGEATAASYVDIGDVDGDGIMEILSFSGTNDEILIHKSVIAARLEVVQDGIEGSQNIELKVSLNNPNDTGAPITFDIAEIAGGTTTSGNDFQSFDGQIIIPEGESVVTFPVVLEDDTDVEMDETLNIELSNPSDPGIVIASSMVTTTIVSEDLVVADLSVSTQGSEDGPVSAEFTVTLSEAIQSDVSFDVNDLRIGTATRGEDYVYLSENATITVLAGETTGTFSVPIISDDIVEPQETFTLEISNPSIPSLIGIGTASAEGTIVNFGGVNLEGALSIVASGEEGLQDIEVAVTLSSANPSATDPIVFNLEDLSASFGTAVAGEDYTAIDAAQISIPAGQESGTYTISINDDELVEVEEIIFLNVSVDSKPADMGELTITNSIVEVSIVDNDQFSVILSVNDIEESETGGMIFTATLNTPNETGTVLAFDITDTNIGTAISSEDYDALDANSKILIAQGASSGTFALNIINDTDLETDETVELMIANSGSTNAVITTPTAVGTILNDEVLTATFSRIQHGSEINTKSAEFSVDLNGRNLSGSPIELTITDATELGSGKAISGSDYTFTAPTINIADGDDSAILEVGILADTRLEGTETFTLQLNPTPVVLVSGNGRATANIVDDLTSAIGIDANVFFEQSVAEGEDLVAVVALSSPNTSGAPITIDIADTSAGTAVLGVDYQALAQTQVTIPSNERQASVAVTTLTDEVLDGEKGVELQISNPSNVLVNIINDKATGSILENTEATAELSVVTPILSEDGGAFVYEVTISKLNESGSAITFDLVDVNTGSALERIDYVEIPANTKISIPNGQMIGTYSVSIVDDVLIENDETIVLEILNPSLENVSITNNTATATITDNDDAALQVSEHNLMVAESGTMATFTLALEVQPLSNVVINLLVQDASEVVVDVSRLIFAPSNWNIPQVVTVSGLDDEELDGDVVSEITVSVEASLSDYSFRSLASEVISVTNEDNQVLSVDDFIANDIRYFPNPVKQTLFIESKNEFDNLSMYNIIGQEVLRRYGSTKSIDMSNLEAGIYLLKIDFKDTTKTIKVVKE